MLKAIETVYNGYRFRSRLEARWAVFFDALGIRYEYEKEGYDLDGVRYLPDFWLPNTYGGSWPNGGHFLEVKGQMPTETEQAAVVLLTRLTGHTSFLVWGCPGENDMFVANRAGPYWWSDCAAMYEPQEPEFELWAQMIRWCHLGSMKRTDVHRACEIAKQARFEHGEHGAPQQHRRRIVPTIARADNFPQSPCPICGKLTCTTAHNIRLDLVTYRQHVCATSAGA